MKQWTIQTLGQGSPAGAWGNSAKKAAGWPSAPTLGRAMVARFPVLKDLVALVPAEALAGLPEELHGWAAGQFLVAKEAEAITGALGYCMAHGVPVLPVHDSLIVPADAVDVARRGIEGGYLTKCGVVPRVEVERASLPC